MLEAVRTPNNLRQSEGGGPSNQRASDPFYQTEPCARGA